jgi:hypothetical protein
MKAFAPDGTATGAGMKDTFEQYFHIYMCSLDLFYMAHLNQRKFSY